MLTSEPWPETDREWLAEGTYASPFRRTTRFTTSATATADRHTLHRNGDAAGDLVDEVPVVDRGRYADDVAPRS